MLQIKDDVSLLMGNHAIKLGANFNFSRPRHLNGNEHFATLTFFDDPSVIVSNSNGRYPQGLPDTGHRAAVAAGQRRRDERRGLGSDIAQERRGSSMAWFQDDWRVNVEADAEPGVRYDVDFNLMDQQHFDEQRDDGSRCETIGDPNGALPKTPRKDISPRVGFAYDLSGDGRRVIRGGYGLYFDQYNTSGGVGRHRRRRTAVR